MIDWIDNGYGKDWMSPWGIIGLEQRPGYCNRGRVAFKTMTDGAVNLIFNPLLSNAYFFDYDRAIAHLESAINLANSLTDEQLRSLEIDSHRINIQWFIGVDCACYLYDLLLKPTNIEITTFAVVVDPDKSEKLGGISREGSPLSPQAFQETETFVVDEHDGFPRYYLDRDLAMAELRDWMAARAQAPKEKEDKK